MKPPHPTEQLNLPLLNQPPWPIPADRQVDLVMALVDLLVHAAQATVSDAQPGGDDEREADA